MFWNDRRTPPGTVTDSETGKVAPMEQHPKIGLWQKILAARDESTAGQYGMYGDHETESAYMAKAASRRKGAKPPA